MQNIRDEFINQSIDLYMMAKPMLFWLAINYCVQMELLLKSTWGNKYVYLQTYDFVSTSIYFTDLWEKQ